MTSVRASSMAVILVSAVALAACGDDTSNETSSAGAARSTTAQPPATTATVTPPASEGAEVSEAGETLALGTRVVAPYVVYGKAGASQSTTLGVTVLKIRKGKISDFKDFNLDAKQKRTTPYFVDVKYENLGKLKLQRFLMDPAIEDPDGQEYKPLNLIILNGTFKKCPQPSRSRLRGGQSFTLCAPFLLPKGTALERVRFHGDVTKDPYFWK
jgi:hypothetical protein